MIFTADGEIRRWLLLDRKAVTNLDSMLKSRNITLLTKTHIVKAMVFPVVTYGCESWTVQRGVLHRSRAVLKGNKKLLAVGSYRQEGDG